MAGPGAGTAGLNAAAALPASLAPLVLASASPRRAALLAQAGYAFEVAPASVDETPLPGEAPRATCLRLARDKARAGSRARLLGTVLGGDTLIELAGTALGKPRDAAEARAMLERLSGRDHAVLTAVAVQHVRSGRVLTGVAEATVTFAPLDGATLDRYLRSREWEDKAGAYAIQGAAAGFARVTAGSPDTVVGLPVAMTRELLAHLSTELG